MWLQLPVENCEGRECASATCDGVPVVKFIAGDVGSDYCAPCARRIEAMLRVDRMKASPLGTRAPAYNGGAWCKVENGWKWNGPNGGGSTFPQPGGDWDGRLIAAADWQKHELR